MSDLQRARFAIHAEGDGWKKTARLRRRQNGRLFQSDRRRDLGGDGCSADDHQIAAGDGQRFGTAHGSIAGII